MTTPATPVPEAPAAASAPAPAPVIPAGGSDAPQPPAAPAQPKTVDDVMSSLLTPNPAFEGDPEEVTVIIQPPPQEGAAPTGDDGAVPTEPGAGAEGAPKAEGEPKADDPNAAKKPEDQPPPEFEVPDGSTFRVKGPDGKYTELPKDVGHIEIEMRTKDGQSKTYVKSLPELVQMARRGIGSEQVIERTRAEADQIKAHAEEATGLNKSFVELMEEVFSDESGEAFERRRQEFLQGRSPEARAKRAEDALATRDQQDAARAAHAQGMAWYQTQVQPALDQAWTGSPDVSDEARLGKLQLLTAHLAVNGVVPPTNRAEFAAIVAGPFGEWAKAEQAKVAALKAGAAQKEQERLAAQRKAQDAVNRSARPLAPVGKAAPDVPTRAKPKNINEALDFVVRR